MDKSKKTSGKKNKIASLSQSAVKGRDVTDSSTVRDKSAPQAAAAASASVETAERQKDEDELNRLKQENQKLMEGKQRQEAEISALHRRYNEASELIKSLTEVDKSFDGKFLNFIYISRYSLFVHI